MSSYFSKKFNFSSHGLKNNSMGLESKYFNKNF